MGAYFIGRPRIYQNVEDLDKAIEDYFFPVEYDEIQENGVYVKKPRPERGINKRPSLTGLTLALGFCDKSTVYDYQKRPEFSHSIKRALAMVELFYEERLSEQNVAGSIFALKNFGWKDKTETEISGELGIKQITGMEIK